MIIDFKKIINIKTNKDLQIYELNEPIFMNNYLFHYLIIFDKLDILKLYKFPIYKVNDDDQNAFLLASKYNNIEILMYLINEYPEYIYNKNSNNEMFINFLSISNIIKILNLKLNFDLLLNYKLSDDSDEIILDNIIANGTYKEINIILKKYRPFNYPYNYLIINEKLTNTEIINILEKLTFEELNIKNKYNLGLIFVAINKKDLELVKFLLDKKIDVDYYTFNTTYHPLRSSFRCKNYEIYTLIWDYIKKNYNYNSTNRSLDTIAHFLLQEKATDQQSYDILKQCTSDIWNRPNIKKKTPLDLIVNLDFNKYHKLLENKEIIIDDTYDNIWLEFLKTLKIFTYSELDNINMSDYKYEHCNLFQSKFKDMSIYTMYLNDKFKNLYIPNYNEYSLENLNYISDMQLQWVDKLFETTPIFSWFISYENENQYWIHHNLNNLINIQRRSKKKDFAFCYLSIKYDNNILHANIIIYDFINLTIERFDPFGDTVIYDKQLDEILEEELTWSTGFKYLKPSDYLPMAGFQVISDELNPYNQKNGDFGGYCLAWSSWYLEHRIKNKHIPPKILVEKLIKKISLTDKTFSEYIRSYATQLSNYRIAYLTKIGIDTKNISNLHDNNINDEKIENSVVNKFKNLNKKNTTMI